MASVLALADCTPAVHYDYTHLPSGYRWRAVYDRTTGALVFYGQDPMTNETVYVGPDGRYFVFRHPGPIGRGDLKNHWMPHDAR